jgi:predicted ATPase with chaperone activity
MQVERYMGRISGPLLDRIDLHIEVSSVPFQELAANADGRPRESNQGLPIFLTAGHSLYANRTFYEPAAISVSCGRANTARQCCNCRHQRCAYRNCNMHKHFQRKLGH